MSDIVTPSALVAVGNEGQIGDPGRMRLAADDQGERRAGRRMLARDIAERDRAPDGRAEAATGHRADRLARGILDFRALARRRTAVGADADQLSRGPLTELPQDRVGARKAALLAPALADRPGEPGL